MSTKIYYGMRCKTENLQEEIESLHKQMFDLAVKKSKALVDNYFMPKKDEWVELLKKRENPNLEFIENNKDWHPVYFCMIAHKRASYQTYRDIFDVDCSFNFFIQGEWTYINPFGPMQIIENLKESGTLVHYPYWNNTDEPEGVSREDWDRRGDEWECTCDLEKFWKTRNTHIVIELKNRIGDTELAEALYGPNPFFLIDREDNNEAMERFGLEEFKGY